MAKYERPEIIYKGELSIRAGSPIEGRYKDKKEKEKKSQDKVIEVEKENGTFVTFNYNPREGWRSIDPIIIKDNSDK